MNDPRVWFEGEEIPAGTWVYLPEEDDPEERITMPDADVPCSMHGFGPAVEITIPDDIPAVLARARAAREASAS